MQIEDVQERFVGIVEVFGVHMRHRTQRVLPEEAEFIENVVEFAEESTRRLYRTGDEGQTIRVKPLHARIGGGGQNAIRLAADANGRNLPASADKVAEEP